MSGKSPRDQIVDALGEKAASRVDQALMSMLAAEGCKMLAGNLAEEGMADKIGVTVVMFDFGEPGGAMAYASTARRDDFLRLLDDLRGKLAASMPGTPRGD